MWLTRFSIQRPIIVAMLFIALLVYGGASYFALGKNSQPNVNFPVVVVIAAYPGASPAEMERLIIKPIEDQLDGIEHLDQLSATAQEGSAVVVVQFKLGTNLDFGAIDVQRRVDTARVYMPSDLDPPQVVKNGADAPVLTYAVDSKTLTAPALADMLNDRVISDIKHIPNVESVTLSGAAIREFDVDADPLRLMGANATLPDIFAAIANNNSNLPGGRIDRPTVETTVSVHAEINAATDIAALPLTVPGGAQNTLRIGDVASVSDTHQEQRVISHMNGAPGLILDVNRTITSDEVGTTKILRAQMAEIAKKYPQIEFHELFAPADYTQASLNGVLQSLLEGILLTAVVLMLFLHAWRNAAVVMVAIPSSLFATFIVMRVMGLTLDNVSLMGLSLIIGILVDDSIVVLENITRHRDMGQAPVDAAISGRTEIGGAAIAITLVDVVVFLPLAFLSGFVGEYMKEFGIVFTVATLFSLFVSFTLTPMLAAKWSVLKRSSAPPNYLVWFQTEFDSLTALYKTRILPLALRHRWMTFWLSALLVLNAVTLVAGAQAMQGAAAVDAAIAVLSLLWIAAGRPLAGRRIVWGIRCRGPHAGASVASALVCAGAAVVLLTIAFTNLGVQTEFVPDQKNGQIHGDLTFPVGTPLAVTEATLERIETAVLKLPHIDTVRTYAGTKPSGWGSTDGGFVGTFNITLQKSHRPEQDAVVEKLRAILPPLTKGAEMTISGRSAGGSGLPIAFTLSGPPEVIQPAADKLAAYIRSIPGTVNVQTGIENEAPHLTVRIDPGKAAVLGVSPGVAATAARTAVGGVVATKVRTWNGLVNVLLQYPITNRNSIDEIQRIPVRANDGTLIPLGRIATFTFDRAPTKIEHLDKQIIVRVIGDIDRSKTTLGQVMGLVDKKLKSNGFLPSGVTLGTDGDSKYFMEFLGSMAFALLTSVSLIYCLMVILYGSFLTPFVIMFAIPVAIIGALFALAITHQTINLFSAIGLIMLFGLVAKNGILLVDYANTLRKRGLTHVEAILTAGGTRLRPIVMTTAAMVFGMLPLASGHTEGGEIRMSMGIVLIGGLLSSLFLTLFLVPAMYETVNVITRWFAEAADRRAKRLGLEVPPRERILAGATGD
ncbi:MAG TPA: efflux RND transporter permease subunit [Candidatus Acidoferrum sp.]|nr:efflux RND transporter permease subunit [Candidatus Acidoferrum sp.]